MKHATQVELLREAFRSLERGAPPMAEAASRNFAAAYVSEERDAREREVLFRRHPLVVGFSSQLRRPGDFVAESLTPVPILVVRQTDGELRAFVNSCRHRGSRIAEGSGRATGGFTCPYHAWSYRLDGTLESVPDEFGFPGLDRARSGLVELPVAEAHGLVWVSPLPGATIDLEAIVGGLADDLDSYGPGSFVPVETRILRPRMNWKIASDTFWEAYHLKVLHRRTVAKLFVRNLGLFTPFGRSHRYVAVRKTVEELRALPEERWDLLPHATILMNLFPNTVFIMQSDHMEAFRIFPGPTRADCAVAITVLAPVADADPEKWKRTMDLVIGVLDEDFANGETIQQTFECGLVPEVQYGRYENALEHFHRSIREALAESPG